MSKTEIQNLKFIVHDIFYKNNKIFSNYSDFKIDNHKISNDSFRILPDISNWNIKNVKDISELFTECKSLIISRYFKMEHTECY